MSRRTPAGTGASVKVVFVRFVCAAVCFILLVVVTQVSAVAALRQKSPRFALAFMPYDAEARADLAATVAQSTSTSEGFAAAHALALDSLRRTPVNPSALRVLGVILAEQGADEKGKVHALLTQAEKLTRRDQQTQLWLIRERLEAQDLPGAMRQFDIALRTWSSTRGSLFGLLASASTDPRIASDVSRRMKARPHWAHPFMDYMVTNGRNLRLSAYFAENYIDPSRKDDDGQLRTLLTQLGAAGEYGLAWDVYSTLNLGRRSGAAKSGVVNADFESRAGYLPFAWWTAQEGDLFAEPQTAPSGNHGQVLSVGAHSGRSGEAAHQLIRLDSGRYRLSVTAGDVPQEVTERPEVRIRCAQPGETSLLTLKTATDGPAAAISSGTFTVPSACRFQWLSVNIAGSGPAGGTTPWIDDIQIAHAR